MLTLTSPRNHPLVLPGIDGFPVKTTITVELYEKWYGLYLVHTDGRVEEIPFPEDTECCPSGVSAYRDHVPNPRVVAKFAQLHDYHVDWLAIELMVGRWEVEATDNYLPLCAL